MGELNPRYWIRRTVMQDRLTGDVEVLDRRVDRLTGDVEVVDRRLISKAGAKSLLRESRRWRKER
ncbi:MAG TPA: hypothetical protein VGR87_03930 [Candidatus Limnocylindria bacterium]|jgi:hypothetical protein|nr:hypothetical protein [Candidatus Limnocylindria bacterium]